jgi:hypothetical protein
MFFPKETKMKAFAVETDTDIGITTHFLSDDTTKVAIEIPRETQMFPRAHLGFSLSKEGFIPDIIEAFGLRRLRRVYQLGILSCMPIGSDMPIHRAPHTYPHTRFTHSLGVVGIALRVARDLGLDRIDLLALLLTAMIHDALTPCGGDDVKSLNMTLFDEDKNILNLFAMHAQRWCELRDRYSLPTDTPQRVCDALHGRGLLGDIMNIADTLSYMTLDMREIDRAVSRFGESARVDLSVIYEDMTDNPLDMWRYVSHEGDHAYITDMDKLYSFLILRVYLWRLMYTNPKRNLLSKLLSDVYAPYLLSRGRLRFEELTTLTDTHLRYIITHTFGMKGLYSDLSALGLKDVHTYYSDKNAREHLERPDSGNCLLIDGQNNSISTKTGLYYVKTQDGVVPFGRVEPEKSAIIKLLVREQSTLPYYVVTFSGKPVTHSLAVALREAKERAILRLST